MTTLLLGWLGAIGGARALLLPAAPTTWLVDDDGGAGVDFTDIQMAIDAAADDDLIVVQAGSYGSFTLSKNLSMICEDGAATGVGNVVGVDVEASISGLTFADFNVIDCTGTVVLDAVLGDVVGLFSHPQLTVRDCADVRVIEADSNTVTDRPQLQVDNSHVEVVSSFLRGETGRYSSSGGGYGEEGCSGIEVINGGRAYVARTQVKGGGGGDHISLLSGYGGNGGHGIEIDDGVVLLLGRGQDLIKGGRGGSVANYGYSGYGGNGALLQPEATLRHSNVKFAGGLGGLDPDGNGGPGQPLVAKPGSTNIQPQFPDPVLERLSFVQAGGSAQIKLRSNPGSFSRLFVGTVPVIQSTPGVYVDKLVIKEFTYPLAAVPANGVLTTSFPLDQAWGPGTTVYAQAMSIFPGGEIRRTNSVPFVLR